MSVDFGNNLNQKFGVRLPTPFIEGVEVHTGFIKVKIACYLNLTETDFDNWDDYIESLDKDPINVYGTILVDQSSDSIPANGVPLWWGNQLSDADESPIFPATAYDNVLESKISVLSAISKKWTPTAQIHPATLMAGQQYAQEANTRLVHYVYYPEMNNTYHFGTLDKFSDIVDIVDSNNVPIKKMVKEVQINTTLKFVWDANNSFETDESWNYDFISYLENFTPSVDSVTRMGIVAFSSAINRSDFEHLFYDVWQEMKSGQRNLWASSISDIAYCTMVEGGILKTPNEVIYVDAADAVVYDPIQSINSLYYKQDNITLSQIVQPLISMVGGQPSVDSELQSARDNLSYVLSVYGAKPTLLVKLNELRKTFLDTSNITPVGRFYNAFKTKLYNANVSVQRGTLVQPKIISNPRVKDLRESGAPSTYTDLSLNKEARNTNNYMPGTDSSGDFLSSRCFLYPSEFKFARYVKQK